MSAIKIIVVGAAGRMGQEIIHLISEDSQYQLVAGIDKQGENYIKQLNKLASSSNVQVVIDFSTPELLGSTLRWCQTYQVPFVSGTTGLKDKDFSLLEKAAQSIPVLWAPNMSLGIAILCELTKKIGAYQTTFDFQVEEFHHIHKKDRPSGTALKLQETLEKSSGKKVPTPVSIRGGGILGVHKIWAMTEDEVICLEHTTLNRGVFAKGALQAACWIVNKEPGRYNINDIIHLK